MKRAAALAAALMMVSSASLAAIPTASVLKAHMARRVGDFAGSAEHLRTALKGDPESVEIRIKLSRLLMVFSEPDQALSILEEGIKARPDNPELYFEKAKTEVMTGRNKEAAESALKSSELGGGDKANIMAVRLLATTGRGERALEVVDKWVATNPKTPDAWFERAQLLMASNDKTRAEADLKKVLEFRPDHIQTLEMLADILYAKNEKTEALKLYQQIFKANPHQTRARLVAAQILLEDGRRDEAAGALEEAEKWMDEDPQNKSKLSLLYLQAGSPDRVRALVEAVPDEKRDDRLWLFLGLAYLELGKHEQSVKAFDNIKADSPFYDDMVERRALALKGLGRTEEALTSLKENAARNPKDAQAAMAHSSMLQSLEKFAESAGVLEEFISANPDTKETPVFFSLGVARDKLGEWEKAVEYMQRILTINPDDPHALNYVGYTWADHDIRLEEAEKMVARAVELQPKNGYIRDSLGWVFFKQGRVADAIRELEKASALSPEDPVILEHLGDAKLKAGDTEGARKAYEKSLSIDPKSKTVGQKLEALR